MRGRADVAAMVRSPEHQGLIGRGCCHFLGPAVVTVDGDDAVAVCESALLVHRDGRLQRRPEPVRTTSGCAAPTAAGRSPSAPPARWTANPKPDSCFPTGWHR